MPEKPFAFEKELATDFLNSIYDDDLEYATVIFEQYLQQIPMHIKDIEECYKIGVIENFRQKVHKVKPVFSYVGLNSLTDLSEQLEKKCKEAFEMTELMDLYINLKNAIKSFQPIIENQFKKLKEQTAVK